MISSSGPVPSYLVRGCLHIPAVDQSPLAVVPVTVCSSPLDQEQDSPSIFFSGLLRAPLVSRVQPAGALHCLIVTLCVLREVQKAVNAAQSLHRRWSELLLEGGGASKEEVDWTTNELRNSLRSIEWDLEDLDETINILPQSHCRRHHRSLQGSPEFAAGLKTRGHIKAHSRGHCRGHQWTTGVTSGLLQG